MFFTAATNRGSCFSTSRNCPIAASCLPAPGKRNAQQITRPRIRWSLRHCVFENCNRFHGLPGADQLGRLIPNRRGRLPGKLHRPHDQPHKRDQNAPAHAVWNNTAVERPQDSFM